MRLDIRKLSVLSMKGKINDKEYYQYLKNRYGFGIINDSLKKIYDKKGRHYRNIFGNLLPNEYDQLRKSDIIFGENLKQELLWNFSLFNLYSSEINDFIFYKEEFEKQLILGDISEAKVILETIEKEVCVSSWTLEQRFLIEEYSGGIELNKELFSKLSENNTEYVLTCLAEFYSYKAEINTSVNQYYNKLNDYFEKLNYIDLHAFFRFKLAPLSGYDKEDLLRIFTIEGCSSIIDRYLTTIRICQIILINQDEYQDLHKIIFRQIISLKLKINDPIIINILNYYDSSYMNINSDSLLMYELIEMYTKGEYRECLIKAEENIEKFSNNFNIYILMSKCCIHLGINEYILGVNIKSMQYYLVNYLIEIYVGKESADNLISWLLKRAISMNFSGICYQILKFIYDERELKSNRSLNFMSHVNSIFFNPSFCEIYENQNDKINFLNKYEKEISTFQHTNETLNLMRVSEGLQDISITTSSVISIEEIRLLRYHAKSLLQSEQFSEASSLLFDILTNRLNELKIDNHMLSLFLTYKIQTDLFRSYLSVDTKLELAMELFVKSFIENKISTVQMDVFELIEKIKKTGNISEGNISYPIFLNILYKREYSEIYPACANFLEFYSVEKPSELSLNNNFDKVLFIYFLKNVCTMEILDCLSSYEDAQETFEERTNIIQNLLSIDAENEYEYVREISQITQKIKVNSMVTMLDESRIDINVSGLKSDPESFYKENYKRYVSVSRVMKPYFGINLDSLAKVRGFEDLEKLNRIKRELSDLSTLNYSFFKEAIINIRNQFCFNTKYGLDASLSTRIRHGSIRNEMRSPFESNKLILLREDADSQYSFSYEWLTILNNTNEEFQEKLRGAFENISKVIDEKIEMLNQKWIRIRTEDKNLYGLFPFQLDEASIRAIYEQFNENSTIKDSEEFFDLIMLIMWELTEKGLENIRKVIKEDVKSDLLGALDELNVVLKGLSNTIIEDSIQKDLENKIINCRLDVQHQLIKIAEWFKVSENTDDGDFDANLLLDTLITTCEMLNPSYKEITLNREVACKSLFLGITFTYLIDIIRILYDNAVEHSEIRDYNNLIIDVFITEDDNLIKLVMKNNLAEHLTILNVKESILSTQKKLSDINYVNSYSIREGGSGYVKIINILKYKLQAAPFAIIFDINEDRNYVVEILINKQAIISIKKGEDIYEPLNS